MHADPPGASARSRSTPVPTHLSDPAQTRRRIGLYVHGALEGFHQCSQGLQGASEALHGQIQDARDNIDKKLLRMFQSAVKAEKVVRALEVASQLTAIRSLEGAVKIANHHRYRPIQRSRKPLCTTGVCKLSQGRMQSVSIV